MANEDIIKKLEETVLKLEEEKKQLLKLVSHDVKSPFNKLFALNHLLRLVSEDLNEEQLDYLGRMEWVIKEGLTVVRNLMDLRAIENNNIELSLETLQIEPILFDTFKNYSKQTDTKNISILSKIDKVTAWSDKRAIERVFDNLVSNAVKFSPKGSKINVKLSKSNSLLTLNIVSESGAIPADEIQHLFKRGSPLSTRPTHGESALGNGLFIAQNYAQALSGKIEFSQKEALINFVLTMPLKRS